MSECIITLFLLLCKIYDSLKLLLIMLINRFLISVQSSRSRARFVYVWISFVVKWLISCIYKQTYMFVDKCNSMDVEQLIWLFRIFLSILLCKRCVLSAVLHSLLGYSMHVHSIFSYLTITSACTMFYKINGCLLFLLRRLYFAWSLEYVCSVVWTIRCPLVYYIIFIYIALSYFMLDISVYNVWTKHLSPKCSRTAD